MISESHKQIALETIKAVVDAIFAKDYAAIPQLVDRSDLPMEELAEFVEETLRLNDQKTIAPFAEADAGFYEDEDGEGFEVEYLLTEEMVLSFEFFMLEDSLRSVLEDVGAN